MSSSASSDRRFLISVAVVLAVLSSLPYLLGYFRQTPQLAYLGLHGFAAGDTFVYFSYLWQAFDGRWLFFDPYTTEIAGFPILNTFWAVAGQIGGLFRWPVAATFHLARLAAIPAAVGALALVTRSYFSDPRQRRWAVLLATFGSGVSGYVWFLFSPARDLPGYYHLPLDLWVAESNLFLSALHSGHMVLGLALVVAIFACAVYAVERSQMRFGIFSGLLALLLFSLHPFQAPLVFGVMLAWGVAVCAVQRRIRREILGVFAAVAAFSLPVLAYQALAVIVDPVTAGRAARNVQLTPDWYLLLPSYGFLIPGAALGVWRLVAERRLREPQWLLLVAWVVAQLAGMYAPFLLFQRRLSVGLTVPLSLLTVQGWPLAKKILAGRWPRGVALCRSIPLALPIAAMLLFGMSNLVNLANDLGLMVQRNPQVFWPREELDAIRAVRAQTDASSVVFAGPASSYVITGFAGRRVVLGHDVETLDYERKKIEVAWFFNGASTAQQRELLSRYGVTHIYAGTLEYPQAPAALRDTPGLTPVYANAAATLYRVER